jgi:hypothetical protein
MKTINGLGVFWTDMDPVSKEIYQEEVPGLIFYGYWSPLRPGCVDVGAFEEVWNGGVKAKIQRWEGERTCSLSVEVKINVWPDSAKWAAYIEQSLRWFIGNGAVLSWCGGELSSPSLDVFDGPNASGSVYAAFSEEVGFYCGSGLEDEYEDVCDDDLLSFKRVL